MRLLLSLFVVCGFLSAQLKFTEFRLGTYSPKDSKAGFYGTLSAGNMLDANLGYNLEFGYFGKRQSRTDEYIDPVDQITTITTSYTESITMIPLLVKFNFVRDIGTFLFKTDLGIGYAFFWESSEDFANDVTDSRHFNGFMWQLGADAGLQISETGSIYGGFFYTGAALTGNSRKLFGNLPAIDEKNMSGLGFRLTIRVDGMGLL